MSNAVKSALQSHVNTFVTTIEGVVRQLALESVEQVLGQKKAVGGTSRPRNAVGTAAPGAKRDPKIIAKLVEALHTTVVSHPGQRIEPIAKLMDVRTRELMLPVKKLLAAKRIRAVGEKRATTYHPVGASASVKNGVPKKSAAKKPTKPAKKFQKSAKGNVAPKAKK